MSQIVKTALTEYGVKAGFFKHKTGGANSEMGDKPLPPPSVAPPAPPSHPPNSSEFHIGQRVEAKPEGKSKWFGATVMHVNNDGNSFKIKYDSGLWNAWMPVNDPKVSFLYHIPYHISISILFSFFFFFDVLNNRFTQAIFGVMLGREILPLITGN